MKSIIQMRKKKKNRKKREKLVKFDSSDYMRSFFKLETNNKPRKSDRNVLQKQVSLT